MGETRDVEGIGWVSVLVGCVKRSDGGIGDDEDRDDRPNRVQIYHRCGKI